MLANQIFAGRIDYKMIGEEEMHRHDWKSLLEKIRLDLDSCGYPSLIVCLLTCLRFELFCETLNQNASAMMANNGLKVLIGPFEVFKRITTVATGVESTILGERPIFHQVQKAFQQANIAAYQVMAQIATHSLECAFSVRTALNFINPHTYGTIGAEILLGENADCAGLTIIGAGSMVNDFCHYIASSERTRHYLTKPIYVVNRTLSSAARLVQKYRIGNAFIFDLKPEHIIEAIERSSHVFIAISGSIDLTPRLHHELLARHVVDISFPPTLSLSGHTPNYITTAHPIFRQQIEHINLPFSDLKQAVLEEIDRVAPSFFQRISL